MTKQIKSRQRVSDHGEVYTHEREVNTMLDLVADQTNYSQSTFLEPACGTGNFLAEILRRKLKNITHKYGKSQLNYEQQSIIAIGSLYGIDLLPDNVAECRTRLFDIFSEYYQSAFPKTFQMSCLKSAKYILSINIVEGDALSLKDKTNEYIVFSEWKPINKYLIKRREYRYFDLINTSSHREMLIYANLDEQSYIPKPIKEYSAIHFLEIGDE